MGYAGGTLEKPTYHHMGDHTESIQVDFDPSVTSFEKLLEVVWRAHNPCASAYGVQYRSIVFYENESQKALIVAGKARIEAQLGKPVKTAVEKLAKFWPAEDYHQKYALRGEETLLREFKALYPAEPGLLSSTVAARLNGYIAGDGTAAQLELELPKLGLSEAGQERLRRYVR